MTCNWRKLTGDGIVDRCVEHDGHSPGTTDCGVDHVGKRGCFLEDDPCAFEAATCSDCDGEGTVEAANHDMVVQPYSCGRCGGSGTLDTVPTALIGEGSKVMWHGEAWLVAKRWPDSLLLVRSVGRDKWVEHTATYLDHVDVIRAVPPAECDHCPDHCPESPAAHRRNGCCYCGAVPPAADGDGT